MWSQMRLVYLWQEVKKWCESISRSIHLIFFLFEISHKIVFMCQNLSTKFLVRFIHIYEWCPFYLPIHLRWTSARKCSIRWKLLIKTKSDIRRISLTSARKCLKYFNWRSCRFNFILRFMIATTNVYNIPFILYKCYYTFMT